MYKNPRTIPGHTRDFLSNFIVWRKSIIYWPSDKFRPLIWIIISFICFYLAQNYPKGTIQNVRLIWFIDSSNSSISESRAQIEAGPKPHGVPQQLRYEGRRWSLNLVPAGGL